LTPQFQYAVLVHKDDYSNAINILNRSKIHPKTDFSFTLDDMVVIAFDKIDTTFKMMDEEFVIKTLENAGIACISATGMNFHTAPMTMKINDGNMAHIEQ
jgi:hypothetical protein